MKPRILPDWFGLLFMWAITILLFAAVLNPPYDALINRKLFWYPPLLAVAGTAGFIAMRRLRKKYPKDFEALGSPNLFGSPIESSAWLFSGYLLGFRFLRLKDPIVTMGFVTMLSLMIVAAVLLFKA